MEKNKGSGGKDFAVGFLAGLAAFGTLAVVLLTIFFF